MPVDDEGQRTAAPSPESLPSRLSTLLREVARCPEEEPGAGWDRALHSGAVIGRFELIREVGRGGFGVVYEARDRELGRAVAFKAVRPGRDLAAREERLFQEAEAAARLSHPNIVTLFDAGRSECGPYLVFELLRGQPLARRLEQGPLSVTEALHIAIGVASALAHAHAHGVVHRDLTPANVFLGDDAQVKVLDLGLARAFGGPRAEGGTPGYMAPEQLRGAPEDERTDVFALGVLLYRMLANEPPFPDGRSKASQPAAVLHVPEAPALGELVARMLKQDPVQRPRDGSSVLAPLLACRREMERAELAGRSPAVTKQRRPRLRLAALGVAAAAAGVAAGVLATRLAPSSSAPPSIAVLPFEDLSPGKDHEYFSDGLADEILAALARVEGLRVPGRTSCFYFKGKKARLADIGRELNVGTVLEGSVRVAGNRVRVMAEVVNVADGYRRWSRTYDRELTDVFAVQDDIAHAVVDSLQVKLLKGREPSTADHATENPAVYSQYLLGRQEYHRLSREGFRRAVEAYERAVALDPGYAPAWAGLGIPLYYLSGEAPTREQAAAGRRRALATAEKAVALAPNLPDALSTRGILRGLIEYDWAGAKSDLERAIAVKPNDPDTRRRYAVLLQNLGRLQDAIAEARKAADLDPLGQSWVTLGTFYQSAGDLGASETALRRHLAVLPDSVPGKTALARAMLLEDRPRAALQLLEDCPQDIQLWGKAMAEHALGNSGASQEALAALTSRFAHTSPVLIAEVYAWRGDRDSAFHWLERASAEPGSSGGAVRMNPFFRSIQGDPRFTALLRKMRLPVD